jgi:hypothetical protein
VHKLFLLLLLLRQFQIALDIEVHEQAERAHNNRQEHHDDDVGVFAADSQGVHIVRKLQHELELRGKR